MENNPFTVLRLEFGSLYAVSKMLGLSINAVYQWQHRGRVPIKYLKLIETVSEGRVTRKDLRPDIFE